MPVLGCVPVSCSDVCRLHLMAADHPEAGHARAAFLAALQGAQDVARQGLRHCKNCGLESRAVHGSDLTHKVCACLLQQCLARASPAVGHA